ncbi:hypothetical protein OPQ81_002431 [Rhizoctonia solani]|nr:hypothetical protein OPQ81_002431 [Rhizoctonia solani]
MGKNMGGTKRKGDKNERKEPPKRGRVEEDSDSDVEELLNIGPEDMRDRLLEAIDEPALSVPQWFQSISEASSKNTFIDAAQGLLSVAHVIQDLSGKKMLVALIDVLANKLEE